jgi:predicted nucleic acid-binding protein
VVITGRQITDAYLLCLAVKNSGRFVTFDRGISHTASKGARPEHLLLL